MGNMAIKRNHQVDGLKGLAMLIVMIYHFMFRYAELYSPGMGLSLPLISKWGVMGVTIFLVISGYYMAQRPMGGMRLIIDKIGRLWPIYMIGITLCFLLTRILPLPDRTVSLLDYLLNVPFINGWISTPYVDTAHWYITDLIGCILSYSVVNKAKNDRMRLVLITIFVGLNFALVFVTRKFETPSFWSFIFNLLGDGRFSMVLAGEAVYHLVNKKQKPAIIVELLSLLLCLVKFSVLYTITMIVAQVVLWLAIKEYLVPLRFKPLFTIGEASYSIYVLHQNIGFIAIFYISQLTGAYTIWYSITIMFVMLVVGLLVYYNIEVPTRRAFKALMKKGRIKKIMG